jgi:hypothetical protein
MMIDFEDRLPAPRLSWGERALAVAVCTTTAIGLFGQAAAFWSWLAGLFS